mgnify:CR=1 FL=1
MLLPRAVLLLWCAALLVAASEGTGVARVELALAAALTTHGDHSEALVAYDEARQ